MTAAFAHRPTIAVTRHAIAAGHYLAATAGFDDPGGRRQRDRCRVCGRHRARRVAERSSRCRRGGADHDLPRRAARGRDHRRARDLAQGARPRILYARAWRQDPERRAAHRRPGRPRRLDHRAQALRHDELWRGRSGGDPARPRGLSDVPADGGEPASATSPTTAPGRPRRKSFCPTAACPKPATSSARPISPPRCNTWPTRSRPPPSTAAVARPACRPRTTRSTAATSPKRSLPL